jgi:membrane associated rhomboid family serine protease
MKEILAEGNSMPPSIHEVSFHVLLACANRGAGGFYPRVDSGDLDLSRDQLDAALDRLRLGGFLEIADWSPEKGQGYRVTDAGRAAAVRPELLTRPAVNRELDIDRRQQRSAWDEAEHVRRSVLTPPRAIVTPILIGLNVLVYLGTCVYNLQQGQSVADIMNGVTRLPGALVPITFWVRDEWWQLLTYMFLHGSPVHILMNMFCLFSLGNVLEGRWGWKRFLILYFGSGLMGGVAVLLANNNPLVGTVGASGAIAGLLTSLGVWAWMHRHHLPPQFVEAHFRIVGLNLLILIGSGFMPNISMSAHVGGAIGGAILSVPLAWLSPYSPSRHRIVGVICLIVIGGLCGLALEMAPRPEIVVNPMFMPRRR